MTQEQRNTAFKKLGEYLRTPDAELTQLIQTAAQTNPWFTPKEIKRANDGISAMLNPSDIDHWLEQTLTTLSTPKKVGLVLAGNIPLVGFHDILSVLATGHVALIKLSSQDKSLIPYLLDKLVELEPEFKPQIEFIERLEDFDAVIATGSNNTSRYFEYYFSKVPHIIRKNRNSIAILGGDESKQDLQLLGHDIFDYFGLGCRNVSKLYVPLNYQFSTFFEAIEDYKEAGNHNKYGNNYDYNKSIYLINQVKHFDNGFLLLKEDKGLASPLAVVFYEHYESIEGLTSQIDGLSEQIQCVVTKEKMQISSQQVGFGESQRPRLWDYADGINTIDFLSSL